MNFKKLLLIIPVLSVVVIYQNCAKQFVAVTELASSAIQSVTDADCLQNQQHDACLFQKNAVTAGDAPQLGKTASAIDQLQTTAVSLDPLTPTGKLENSSFAVYASGSNSTLAKDPVLKWNYRFSNAADRSKLTQVSAFYWANFAASKALQTTGVFHAAGQRIKIISGGTQYGWVPSKNQIHLVQTTDISSMSLDASVLVYFLGWANLDYATSGRIHQFTQENHVSCTPGSRDCCKSKNGCARAIASGAADYFVAMTFPDSPAVGDGYADKVNGKSLCRTQFSRNPADPFSANLSMTSAYLLCGSSQYGDIYALGSVYASIWWNVRNSPGAIKAEIDRLFMLHLAQLNGDDTFVTAQSKILALDRSHFSGKYSSLFSAEFTRRL